MDNIIKNVASLLIPKPIVENFFGSSASNNFDDETRCSSLNVEYPNTAAVSSLDIRKHGPEKITLYENDRKRIRNAYMLCFNKCNLTLIYKYHYYTLIFLKN